MVLSIYIKTSVSTKMIIIGALKAMYHHSRLKIEEKEKNIRMGDDRLRNYSCHQ